MKKLIIFLLFLLLTGCDYIELNDLSIIKSIAIEYRDNKYTLYAELIDEINQDNMPKTKIITVNENSIERCFNKLVTLSNKSIHYSHIDLLILSTNLDNENLKEIFEYFLSNQNFRNDFLTIASNNLSTLIKESKYDQIEQLVKNNQHKYLIKIDIESIIKKYLDDNYIILSTFEYEDNNVLYKYNIKYINNKTERIEYEK